MFFKSEALRSESELADAIESPNPILYVHSKPSIQVYVKLGWLLKSLNVYVFYSVGYLAYLSLDVRLNEMSNIELLESELGCEVADTKLHLILNGVVLNDRNASLYSIGVKEGAVFEVCLSEHEAIASLLHCRHDEYDIDVIDSSSLLCSRLLFAEVSGGNRSVTREVAKTYLKSCYDERSVEEVVNEVCVTEMMSEIEFIVILQSLQYPVRQPFRLPKTLRQLLSVGEMSRMDQIHEWKGEKGECDPSWVISYEKIKKCVEVLESEVEAKESLWNLPRSVLESVGSELDEDKKKEMSEQ